ncbi:hypothetical protein EDC56_0457 [Sinobacterium caligoides]|uniref:Transcriptional regulator SutA RNAP-binding domain-containing protein n=1 Tax=Sinobacterium caligoides TaxID=933926 RepID=A0A3N2DYL2_9GAMM|nr:hypothetical protein [Sinobacterium caligoides]ROS04940.1 hypothetical protein EDC56_0457 [Sinobacterium caligoides]
MKKLPSKADIRADLDAQINAYLDGGGQVNHVQRGLSGRIDTSKPLSANSIGFEKPKDTRTSLGNVVSEIEARRSPAKEPASIKKRVRKKIIYDDFGEPLRWVWEE